jgi:hypothetical protein
MNIITKNLVTLIGPMVIETILDAIISEEKLTSFRDELISFFRKTADKTVTEIDDYLVEIAVNTIMAPGKYIDDTMGLLAILRKYVESSQTEIDDIFCLPILDRIQLLGITAVEK